MHKVLERVKRRFDPFIGIFLHFYLLRSGITKKFSFFENIANVDSSVGEERIT